MVDHLAEKMHQEWNLMNSDANHSNHLLKTQSLTRKLSDQTGQHSNNHSLHHHTYHHHHHHHQQQQQSSTHSPPMITTTDYSDQSSLTAMQVPHSLTHRKSSDTGYDTDGGIGSTTSTSKSRHHNSHGYEHFVSPRLPKKQTNLYLPKQSLASSHRQRASPHSHLTVEHNHEDKDDDSTHEDDEHRRHIRFSRRISQRPSSTISHGSHATHSSTISRHEEALAQTTSGRPFRLIFMRHSERANQALGSDWYSKAFRTSTYQPFDPNLPPALPRRNSNEAYEFDAPLTVNGLKNARHTGRAMLNTNLVADVCLSSSALRCIQTAERVLTGMERTDRVPIRIEPGLFECPHLNYKIADSFMTKKELIDNGFKIKTEYKPLIQKINTPESLDEYFNRCVIVMRGIIDRYGHHGGTVLIVTHAPGLLALTDAIQGKRTQHDNFYRIVGSYPPLAAYIAEYDGKKWNHSDQPFAINISGQ